MEAKNAGAIEKFNLSLNKSRERDTSRRHTADMKRQNFNVVNPDISNASAVANAIVILIGKADLISILRVGDLHVGGRRNLIQIRIDRPSLENSRV